MKFLSNQEHTHIKPQKAECPGVGVKRNGHPGDILQGFP